MRYLIILIILFSSCKKDCLTCNEVKVVQWYDITSQGTYHLTTLNDTSVISTFEDCGGKKEPYDRSLGGWYNLPGKYEQRNLTYKICP